MSDDSGECGSDRGTGETMAAKALVRRGPMAAERLTPAATTGRSAPERPGRPLLRPARSSLRWRRRWPLQDDHGSTEADRGQDQDCQDGGEEGGREIHGNRLAGFPPRATTWGAELPARSLIWGRPQPAGPAWVRHRSRPVPASREPFNASGAPAPLRGRRLWRSHAGSAGRCRATHAQAPAAAQKFTISPRLVLKTIVGVRDSSWISPLSVRAMRIRSLAISR